MDIESLRNKNIQRNQDLLRQLNLDSIHESIGRDAQPKPRAKRVKKEPAQKTRVIPTRRSRRLASTEEEEEEDRVREEAEEKERLRQLRLKELRSMRLEGDLSLRDLLADLRLGELVHESRVLEMGSGKEEGVVKNDDDNGAGEVEAEDEGEVKRENEEAVKKEEEIKTEDSDVDNTTKVDGNKVDGTLTESEDSDRLSILSRLDYSSLETSKSERLLKDVRASLLKMTLSSKADPRDFKLTANRITSIYLHLATEDRLVAAGDTNGNLGLWAVDSPYETVPVIVSLKPHGRTISRISQMINSPHQLVTASYDGSCRLNDLTKLVSMALFVVGEKDDTAGISDLSVVNNNLFYATTLAGHFLRRDPREHSKNSEYLRLHDKKIGGFCVNPNASHQIATASLDRSMRIWDLRNIKKQIYSELDEVLDAPHLYGAFPSRLSISNVDWNENNVLVCNGYDDKIQLLDYSKELISEWSETYRPSTKKTKKGEIPENLRSTKTISHNCQTGRWVSILKARWHKHPADGFQKFAIANMKRSIDVFSETGDRLVSLYNADMMTAVPAVIAFHPTQNWVVGGSSSGKVFLFE